MGNEDDTERSDTLLIGIVNDRVNGNSGDKELKKLASFGKKEEAATLADNDGTN